jgi:hypothetical protein
MHGNRCSWLEEGISLKFIDNDVIYRLWLLLGFAHFPRFLDKGMMEKC